MDSNMDYFANHSIFFTLSLVVSPFWTLLLFSNTHMNPLGWIVSFFFSNEAIIYSAFTKGYHTSNPWAVYMFIVLYLFQKTLHQIKYRLLVRALRIVMNHSVEPYFVLNMLISAVLRSCFSTSVVVEFLNFSLRNLKSLLHAYARVDDALREMLAHMQGRPVADIETSSHASDRSTIQQSLRQQLRRLRQTLDSSSLSGNGNDFANGISDAYEAGMDINEDSGGNASPSSSATVMLSLYSMLATLLQELANAKERLLYYQDSSRLNGLNRAQLQALKTEVCDILEPINERLERMGGGEHDRMDDRHISQQCCYCLDAPPEVSFNPCRHQCLCQPCFHSLLQKQNNSEENSGEQNALENCFICKNRVLSWYVHSKSSVLERIAPEEYHARGNWNTSKEMVMLHEHIRNNPQVLEKLRNPLIFRFAK